MLAANGGAASFPAQSVPTLAFGQSKYYVDSLSVNVKRGNRQKLCRGEWPNKAPSGYLNDMSIKTIQVDKKRAKFVRQAFEMYATGGYGQQDIIEFFNKNKIFNRSGHIVHAKKLSVCSQTLSTTE